MHWIGVFVFLLMSSVALASEEPTPEASVAPRAADATVASPSAALPVSSASVLETSVPASSFVPCAATPGVAVDARPAAIASFSNLRRLPGEAEVAEGFLVVLEGTVVDEQCVPIEGVAIKLWQRDAHGFYEAEYSDAATKTPEAEAPQDVLPKRDPHFAYAGTATTNNAGQFRFLTVMPESPADHAPSLNVELVHPRFPLFSSQLFFAQHPKNSADSKLTALPPEHERALMMRGAPMDSSDPLAAGRVYRITIALSGKARFERF